MYAYVDDRYLHDFRGHSQSVVPCLVYGVSALPSRGWGLSALMSNGGIVQHLPVTAFHENEIWDEDHQHELPDLQLWSCYGQEFEAHEYKALSELRVRCYLGDGTWEMGRYWFTAAPYGDYFSRTPDQHKHFNFVWLECGALACLPGNRLLFSDPSFTVDTPEWGQRPHYRVNTRYWYPEDREEKFDKTIGYETG